MFSTKKYYIFQKNLQLGAYLTNVDKSGGGCG